MSKKDFFSPDGKTNYELTHVIIAEEIGTFKKIFMGFDSENEVIENIASITNSKHHRIHKIMIMNEEGETRELAVQFRHGGLRLILKEQAEREETSFAGAKEDYIE